MRALVQRVKKACVRVDSKEVSSIGNGMMILVGIGREDGPDDIEYLARKISKLRIFEDDHGRMNLDVKQVSGAVLSVPQFTLYADTRKGNRPGFDQSAVPKTASQYWMQFNEILRNYNISVKEGVFAAHMEVELLNDGPVTIWMDSR